MISKLLLHRRDNKPMDIHVQCVSGTHIHIILFTMQLESFWAVLNLCRHKNMYSHIFDNFYRGLTNDLHRADWVIISKSAPTTYHRYLSLVSERERERMCKHAIDCFVSQFQRGRGHGALHPLKIRRPPYCTFLPLPISHLSPLEQNKTCHMCGCLEAQFRDLNPLALNDLYISLKSELCINTTKLKFPVQKSTLLSSTISHINLYISSIQEILSVWVWFHVEL